MLKVTHESEGSELIVVARRRSLFHRILAAIGIFVVLVGLTAGGLYWRVTRSSIGLGFLSGSVEAALEERLPTGSRVSVGSTAIAYRDADGIVLRITNLELSIPGTATVSAEELSTSTSAAILFGGKIGLHSVTVSGLSIGVSTMPRLTREGSSADLIRHASTTFMGQVLKADTIMRDAGLQEVVIRDAAIHLDDRTQVAGPSLTITNANWVPLGEGRSKAWMQLRENDGPPWDLTVERRRTPAGDATVTIEVENLPISALAPKLSGADGGPYFRSVLTLQARMAQAEDGSFIGLRSIISTADGKFSLNGTDEVNVDATAVSLVLDATGNRLTIPNAEVRTRTGRVQLEGVSGLTEIGNVAHLPRARRLLDALGDTKTVQLTGGGGLARINFSDIGLQVERFDLTTPEGTASVIGQASLGGPTPGLSFALSLSRMPASVARALWPPFVAAKTADGST